VTLLVQGPGELHTHAEITLARCGCSGTCSCNFQAGPGISLAGTGSTSDPVIISATGGTIDCDDVRPCLSAGQGISYNPATGLISARLSTDAGNQVTFGGDGGLYNAGGGGGGLAAVATTDSPCLDFSGNGQVGSPLTASPIVDPVAGNLLACSATGLRALLTRAACGLTGNGSAASPLGVNVGAWPFACTLDTEAGGVYCDSTGRLRSDPRGKIQYFTTTLNSTYANLTVPTTTATGGQLIETRTLDITNPSGCYDALAITEVEVDVDFIIPAGGRAGHFVYGDEMYRFENRGSATVSNVHTQTTKVVGNTAVPAGGGVTVSLDIGLGFGLAGATYNRIQSYIRAIVIAI
jgi:hypothetical protein